MTQKFSERERKLVIKFLEEHLGERLVRVTQHRTFFTDGNGIRYLVLGATGDWHGIPKTLIDLERTIGSAENGSTESKLVLGRLLKTKVVVYRGSLGSLVQQKGQLSVNKKTGDYQFGTLQKAHHVEIKQIPGLTLEKVGEIPLKDS